MSLPMLMMILFLLPPVQSFVLASHHFLVTQSGADQDLADLADVTSDLVHDVLHANEGLTLLHAACPAALAVPATVLQLRTAGQALAQGQDLVWTCVTRITRAHFDLNIKTTSPIRLLPDACGIPGFLEWQKSDVIVEARLDRAKTHAGVDVTVAGWRYANDLVRPL